jgi:hypothetical protein
MKRIKVALSCLFVFIGLTFLVIAICFGSIGMLLDND